MSEIPLNPYKTLPESKMIDSSLEFYQELKTRRTVRDFSAREVPIEVVLNCIRTASTAPNGANKQPWHFALVKDQQIKHNIRIGAEEEERAFYQGRASAEWLEALKPFGTDANKPFLEIAPYLIVIFQQRYGLTTEGKKFKHYYTPESVGIATGLLITALHRVGLATLTHTPSPMGFLNKILNRPSNEKPFLILVVGYPAEGATVPDIQKKSEKEVLSIF